MSLKDLTKEQKQYVALGVLAASIVVILMVLAIRFSMATISTAKEELDDLSGKINKANRALSRSRQTSEEYVETVTVLKSYLTNAPPERNYYSWATEVIYSTARFADLEIDSIDEITIPPRKQSGSDDPAAISFESYSLRVTAYGGYENTKYFLNLLKQDYPLVRFSGVEISKGQNRDKHDVQFFMQWPFNFSEISKNWDVLASKKMKVAELNNGGEAAVLAEPVNKSAAVEPSVGKPNPVREPYPPTTRPEANKAPAPGTIVEPSTPEMQSGMEIGSEVAQSTEDAVPKPATDDEVDAILSYRAPSGAQSMDAEPQHDIILSESTAEFISDRELEADAVMETAGASELDSEPVIEQEPPVINAPEIHESAASTPEEPGMIALTALESGSASERLVGLQPASVPEGPSQDVSNGKSEKDQEENLNQERTVEDAPLSSLLDRMEGEANEK